MAADDWILFIERHPEFFELSKSRLFISLLESIASGAKSFHEIASAFPRIAQDDLGLMLETLVRVRAAEKFSARDHTFYSATERGKELLSLYNETRGSFKI